MQLKANGPEHLLKPSQKRMTAAASVALKMIESAPQFCTLCNKRYVMADKVDCEACVRREKTAINGAADDEIVVKRRIKNFARLSD